MKFGTEAHSPSFSLERLQAVEVSAPTRIHMTLCDLGRATARAYGGIGFALETPQVCVRIFRDCELSIGGLAVDASGLDVIKVLCAGLSQRAQGETFGVELRSLPIQHSGLGTKTALLLSIASGVNELLQLNLSPAELRALTGRGGTSGVGVHSFFDGGIVWDAGHLQSTVPSLLPSSARAAPTQAPRLARIDFPENWVVGILSPKGLLQHGELERAVFEEHTPIPRVETLETIGLVAHGLMPAFLERSLPAVSSALKRIHGTGFKAREVQCQSYDVMALLDALMQRGFATGMSSLGPTIYTIIDRRDPDAQSETDHIAAYHDAPVIWAEASNNGFTMGRLQ